MLQDEFGTAARRLIGTIGIFVIPVGAYFLDGTKRYANNAEPFAFAWGACYVVSLLILVRRLPDPLSVASSGGALIEEVRFAADSPVEGDGFEPSVPRKRNTSLWAAPLPSPQFAFRNEDRLLRDRDRWFESISLQHGVWCELAEAMPVRTVRMSAPPARRSTHRFCAGGYFAFTRRDLNLGDFAGSVLTKATARSSHSRKVCSSRGGGSMKT